MIFKVGIDTLPFNIPFEVLRTPVCPNNALSFTLLGDLAVLTDVTPTGGNIQLESVTIDDLGIYMCELKAIEGEVSL